MNLEEKQALMRERNKRYRVTREVERFELKTQTLSHYGKNGKLQCCWERCGVRDIDVLSLDHVNNDGRAHRRETKTLGGSSFYRRLRKQGYPFGFQTLCMNHQFKKEQMRKRNSTCQ